MSVDLSIPLDELIAAKLGSLSLKDDDDTVAFVKDLVEEDSFEPEDRKSAILGLLEAEEDGEDGLAGGRLVARRHDGVPGCGRRAATSSRGGRRLSSTRRRRTTSQGPDARAGGAAQGRLFEEIRLPRGRDRGGKGGTARSRAGAGARKGVRRPEKQRKKALDGVDLLALPNLNKHHVVEAERKRKVDSSSAAQAKRERDLADRRKQKDDAAKKLEDKRKKAQKVERKG